MSVKVYWICQIRFFFIVLQWFFAGDARF